jgi:hypothetical protein
MLLAKVIATAYVLLGLFGLIVVSVPSNYAGMFHEPGKPWVGLLRQAHAYVALFFIVACGLAVWFFPTYASALAIAVLIVLVAGKAFSVLAGNKVRCVRCLVTGVLIASLSTWAIVSGTSPTA